MKKASAEAVEPHQYRQGFKKDKTESLNGAFAKNEIDNLSMRI